MPTLFYAVRNRQGDLDNVPVYDVDDAGETVVHPDAKRIRPDDIVGMKVNYDSPSEEESALATLRAHAASFGGTVPAEGTAYPRSGFFAFVSKRSKPAPAPDQPLSGLPV